MNITLTWDEYEADSALPPFVGNAVPGSADEYGIALHSDGKRHVEVHTFEDHVEARDLTQEEWDAYAFDTTD